MIPSDFCQIGRYLFYSVAEWGHSQGVCMGFFWHNMPQNREVMVETALFLLYNEKLKYGLRKIRNNQTAD